MSRRPSQAREETLELAASPVSEERRMPGLVGDSETETERLGDNLGGAPAKQSKLIS